VGRLGYNTAATASYAFYAQGGTTGVAGVSTSGQIIPGNGAGAMGNAALYSGTGAPTLSAPSGSIYLRYDGSTGARFYANTSTASSSGTTWTALLSL
jgi:hypothetical protein